MIDLANRLYKINFKSDLLRKFRVDSLVRFFVRNVFNILIPLYLILTKGESLTYKQENCKKLIVSLTSFPLRIGRLWIVIESLMRQTLKPDMIILWLSKEQFPNEIRDLPKRLVRLVDRGLDIRFVSEDIRSYKKFYYVFQECPDDVIITTDDDIIYPSNMIESLYKKHKRSPESVVVRYCYEMKQENNRLLSYRDWKFVSMIHCYNSDYLFFGSGGGTLFPPRSCHKDILSKEIFMKICSNADDVWLNLMVRLNGTSIVKVDDTCAILPVLIRQDFKLFSSNIYENDRYIQAVQDVYGDVFLQNSKC